MKAKNKITSRYKRNNPKLSSDEIIDLDESFSKKKYQRRNKVNSESKRDYKKMKKNNDIVELYSSEDFGLIKRQKKSSRGIRDKNSNSKIIRDKKGRYKSITKVKSNRNPSINKNVYTNIGKKNKYKSISLEESGQEEEENIPKISPKKYPRIPSKNKNKKIIESKTPNKIYNRYGKKSQKKQKGKANNIIQYELSSSNESDIEEQNNKNIKNKKLKKRDASLGHYSSRKSSKNNSRQKYAQEKKKSKSIAKIIEQNERLLSFLGKKRKSEKTPEKSPIRISLEKTRKNPNNAYETLNKLVNKFGFDIVLEYLCKSEFDPKNKLDNSVKKIKETCPTDILPIFLIRMLFTYFDEKDKEKDKEKKIEEKSPKKIIKINEKEEKDSKGSKKISSSLENTNTITQNEIIELNDSNNIPIKSNIIPVSINSKQENNNINLIEDTSPAKTKIEKKNISIGSHYNKGENGYIYRYQVHKLDGKGNAIFKCYDDKCSGEGMYDLNSKVFIVIQEHNLKHQEHDYILQCEPNDEKVFKDMKINNKNDAQVFKEGNERNVKIY